MPDRLRTTNRRPKSAFREIRSLYDRILHWFYGRGDRGRALKYASRFEELLTQECDSHESIFGEECWSLLEELKGDLDAAIRYREHEIELIVRAWDLSRGTPSWDYVVGTYGPTDLLDRLDLLAMLLHDRGDLDRAIDTLLLSKRLSEDFKVPFDGDDLLFDYLSERARSVSRPVEKALGRLGQQLAGFFHATDKQHGDRGHRRRRAGPRQRRAAE